MDYIDAEKGVGIIRRWIAPETIEKFYEQHGIIVHSFRNAELRIAREIVRYNARPVCTCWGELLSQREEGEILVSWDCIPLDRTRFNAQAVLFNGRAYAPFREIFNAFMVIDAWSPVPDEIFAESWLSIVGNEPLSLRMRVGSTEMTLNDETVTLDAPPVQLDGRIHIPLRAVFEALGTKVDWDEETQTVNIFTALYFAPERHRPFIIESLTAQANDFISQLESEGIL